MKNIFFAKIVKLLPKIWISDGLWSKLTWIECEHNFTFQHLSEK